MLGLGWIDSSLSAPSGIIAIKNGDKLAFLGDFIRGTAATMGEVDDEAAILQFACSEVHVSLLANS